MSGEEITLCVALGAGGLLILTALRTLATAAAYESDLHALRLECARLRREYQARLCASRERKV